jgi:hypothetical protein
MSGYQEVKDAAAQAADEAAAAQAEYDEIADAYVKVQSTIIQRGVKNPYEDQFLKAGSALDELQETAETASAAYDDMIDQITEYCTQLGYSDDEIAEFIASLEDSTDAALDFADGMQSTEEPVVEFSDAVSTAVDSVSEQVQKLAEEYDDVYSSAYESFSGQYELWETADEVATTSVDNIMAAMQSQEEYWESYAANLENLAGRNIEGLSDMVASMDDGSAASASALAAMADASDEQLQSMVEQYQSLQDAQSQTADDVAELETNFSTTMEQLEQDLEETIDNMNMEDDAATAAKNTMDAYVQTILDSKSSAASAADQVAKATAAALGAYDPSTVLSSSYTLTPSHVTMPEHALGTTNAEDAFIAGENGPELILGRSGSTVFPSEETDRIINAVSDRTDNPQITTLTTADSVSTAQSNSTGQASESASEKKVTISLEGAGSISVSGQADKESVWESMKDDIKATFMSILQEEIYEEGDMAYEF